MGEIQKINDQIAEMRERLEYLHELREYLRVQGALQGGEFTVTGALHGIEEVEIAIQYGERAPYKEGFVSVPKRELGELLLKYLVEPSTPEGGEE